MFVRLVNSDSAAIAEDQSGIGWWATIGDMVPSKSVATNSRGEPAAASSASQIIGVGPPQLPSGGGFVADQQPDGQVEALAHIGGGCPTGKPRKAIRQPDVRDHASDVVLILGWFTVAHGSREHVVDDLLDVVDLARSRRVGKHVGAGHRLRQEGIALHCSVELADHDAQSVVGVSPVSDARSALESMRSNSRPSADTSRCTFEGK